MKAAILFFLMSPAIAWAQKFYLKKDKKAIQLLQKAPIGILARKDTVSCNDYSIFNLSSDSITIRKATKKEDTVLENVYDLSILNPNTEYEVVKWYKRNSIQCCLLRKIVAYDYKTFAYSDITTIYYINSNKIRDGCIGCFFVPGLNVYYILSTWKHMKKYDLSKWKIYVQT